MIISWESFNYFDATTVKTMHHTSRIATTADSRQVVSQTPHCKDTSFLQNRSYCFGHRYTETTETCFVSGSRPDTFSSNFSLFFPCRCNWRCLIHGSHSTLAFQLRNYKCYKTYRWSQSNPLLIPVLPITDFKYPSFPISVQLCQPIWKRDVPNTKQQCCVRQRLSVVTVGFLHPPFLKGMFSK